MDMIAVTTPIPVGGNAAVPDIANDAVSKLPQPNGVGGPINNNESNTVLQPTVTNAQSLPTDTVQTGTETQWNSIPTTISESPTISWQTGVATAVPTTQASIEPVAASSSSNSNNLSGGAVAGIAIATLLLGAALAFACAFLLFKRRTTTSQTSRSGPVNYTTYTDSTPELVVLQKSAGRNSPYVQVSQTPLPAPPAPVPQSQSQLDFLPAPAHDSEIAARVQSLFAQIHRHIETYYRDVHASITPSMAPALSNFGAEGVNMAELLQDCASPTTALKHALTGYVSGITGPGESLFPSELNGVHGSNGDPNILKAVMLNRRLGSWIYANTQHSEQAAVREAAEHFSLTFFPWANPGADDTEKDDDLTHVIAQAMETRIWLFGQPGEYVFRWDGVGTRGVVVCPEVVRVDAGSGREGVVLESRVVGV